MKISITFLLVISFSLILKAQNIYYVSTSGNDLNNGTSISTAWRTITYAASNSSPVSSGDTVYIKSGNYGSENIVFETDGTLENPITFEGYQSIPGDNPNLNWDYVTNRNFNADIMPLLEGMDRTTGIGMTLHNRKYIILSNFQIKNYEHGLYAYSGNNIKIKNIIAMDFGDQTAAYNGKGIKFGSLADNNQIDNCIVYNACAEGLTVVGNNNAIKNCKVYCDDNSNGHEAAMDYYIHVGGNNNIVEGCYVERVGNLEHVGHGIDLKTNCENNLIKNCVSKGMSYSAYELRHRSVRNNILENCVAIGGGGFTIRDGASYNTLKNCIAIDARAAVSFFDTAEDEGAQYAGAYNVFENCIFRNTTNQNNNAIIAFHSYSVASIAENNTFKNCVIDGGNYLFTSRRENDNNKMVNCIVQNVANYYYGEYPLNFSFEYSNFWNNGFTIPTGTNITSFDPLFVDLPNNDYHLTSISSCIDAGTSIDSPFTDFDGNPRNVGNSVDIGAYEYNPSLNVTKNTYNNSILLYPNPTTDSIILKSTTVNLSKIKIYDILGKEISNLTQKEIINQTSVKINVSNLSSGIYLLITKTTHTIFYKK